MSLAHENPGFNIPNQAPEKDKKQVTRRGLLAGLGTSAVVLIGSGAAVGSYLAGRGNEAPAPAPEPAPKAPVETAEPTVEPTETEEPVVEPEPTAGELTRTYGGIETDQSHEDLVQAMSFEKGMTDEEIMDRFVSGYNYVLMAGVSNTLFTPDELGKLPEYDTVISEAEVRGRLSAEAFAEAILGENWVMDDNIASRQEFINEMIRVSEDSARRWVETSYPASADIYGPDDEYIRSFKPAGVKDTSYDDMLGGEVNLLVIKGTESIVGSYLLDEDLDEEFTGLGKFRGFELGFEDEEDNQYGRPVLQSIRWDEKVANI